MTRIVKKAATQAAIIVKQAVEEKEKADNALEKSLEEEKLPELYLGKRKKRPEGLRPREKE